jgi:hypothetical protein
MKFHSTNFNTTGLWNLSVIWYSKPSIPFMKFSLFPFSDRKLNKERMMCSHHEFEICDMF